MRIVTAVLVKHSTEDGLIEVFESVPIGKNYQVDLDTIRVIEAPITDPDVPDGHRMHRKEVISLYPEGTIMPTEVLHIPGHVNLAIYTHKDKDGVLWRFAGGRPISQIADEVMEGFGFNEKDSKMD